MTEFPAFPAPVAPNAGRTYQLTKLSSVRPRPIQWLSPGRIPYGALTILAGRPGEGKSQFSLGLSAMVSRHADVLLIGAEDALEDTVRPRLMAHNADLDRVSSFDPRTADGREDMAVLPHDIPLLERAIKEVGATFVVIDPFAAHLAPELDSHNDHSIRQALGPLAHMARATGVAVLCVAHPRKGREGHPMEWVGGGVGVTGAARSVLLFGKGEADGEWEKEMYRYLVHIKANGAPLAPTLRCSMQTLDVTDGDMVIPTSRVVPDGDIANFYPSSLV